MLMDIETLFEVETEGAACAAIIERIDAAAGIWDAADTERDAMELAAA